jgi:hypothetical protein
MSEWIAELWNLVMPILGVAVFSAILSALTWASHTIRSSDWYEGQPGWKKKIIDLLAVYLLGVFSKKLVWTQDIEMALKAPVRELMPAADNLRDAVSGQINADDADMLTRIATEEAKAKLKNSSFGKKLNAYELQAKITEVVPVVVDKEKEKRKARLKPKGGTSPGARRF